MYMLTLDSIADLDIMFSCTCFIYLVIYLVWPHQNELVQPMG